MSEQERYERDAELARDALDDMEERVSRIHNPVLQSIARDLLQQQYRSTASTSRSIDSIVEMDRSFCRCDVEK